MRIEGTRRSNLNRLPENKQDLGNIKSINLDQITDLLDGRRGLNFRQSDFSKLEDLVKDYVLESGRSEKLALEELKSVYDSESSPVLKRSILDASIRLYHPKYQHGERGICFHSDLFAVFGRDLLPPKSSETQTARDVQTLSTIVGNAFAGPRGGTTLSEFTREITDISTEMVSRFESRGETVALPEDYTLQMIELREEMSRIRNYNDSAKQTAVTAVKEQLVNSINEMGNNSSLDFPLGMYGTDMSHALNMKLVKSESGDLWAIIDNPGESQRKRAGETKAEYSPEVIPLKSIEGEGGDDLVQTLVDRIVGMMVEAKPLKDQQDAFYRTLDSVKATESITEKPRLVELIEMETHKEMTQPNCVRKTHNALMSSQFTRWADSLLSTQGITNKDIVFSFSKLLYSLYKQNFQDKPLYEKSHRYQESFASKQLSERIQRRHDKIIAQFQRLSTDFRSEGISMDSLLNTLASSAPGFRPWVNLLYFERETSNPLPDISYIPIYEDPLSQQPFRGLGPSAELSIGKRTESLGPTHIYNMPGYSGFSGTSPAA